MFAIQEAYWLMKPLNLSHQESWTPSLIAFSILFLVSLPFWSR